MIQISIIRTEGLSEDPQYSLKLDNTSVPSSETTSDCTFTLKHKGLIKLCCKISAKQELFSSFNSSLLPSEGFQWLPLSASASDHFSAFPEEVSSPKLLIMVSSDSLPPIDESPETECESCEVLKASSKKLQADLSKTIKEAKNNFDLLTAENEKNKLLVKKFSNLLSDCKKELEFYKVKFEEERKKCNEVSEKLKSLSFRLFEPSGKENEWKKLRPVSTSPAEFDLNIATANGILKSSLSQNKFKSRRPLIELHSSSKVLKETDKALKDFLQQTNRPGLITKDSGNNYMFGNRKVLISLKHGNLLCRVGGGFENIEEFINKNHSEGRARSSSSFKHKRHLTIDSVKKQFNDKIENLSRASPELIAKQRLRPQSTSFPECY